ncbi:fibronectin type III domain-containing protein 7-like [Hoplias malabaricus]|uniref:fibronectin type III domain-containing protein 7-like n=1 Tax=Hoplias malabaricus TaxID=27720 RepID=UPI003462BFF8
MAKDSNCSSASSTPVHLQTAPCVPTLSGVSLDCSSGSALAVWSGSGGPDQYYVSAVDSQGGVLSCNNTQTLSCTVWGLHCGRTYTFSVTAAQGQCTSSASNTLQSQTAPCPAQAIQTTIDCHNSTAIVSWTPGVGAVSHSALLQSSDGHTYICNSTTSSCSVTNLPCGQIYSVKVAALGQSCSSVNSTGSPVSTAPCAPQNVSASVNCSSNSATVLWQSSQGATYYFVTATSSNGQTTNCTSTSTSCSLPPLVCGQNYTITVMAKDSNCTSASSTPVHLQTGSCRPENLTAQVLCANQTVALDWSDAPGALQYMVTVSGDQGLLQNFSATASALSVSLPCGQSYIVIVQGQNQHCISQRSAPVLFRAGPCVPSGLVVVQTSCDSAGAVLSWTSSAGADVYVVNGWNRDGHTLSVLTSLSNISLPKLYCSQEYNLTVSASNQQCNSTPSLPAVLQTGPCSAAAVSAVLDCVSGLAVMSWQPSNGTALYTASLLDSSGSSHSCVGVGSQCNISGLTCGKNYSASVSVLSNQCNLTTTLPNSLQTAPCVPVNISVTSVCANNSAVVVWNQSQGAISYYVYAVSSNGNVSCQSTSPSCILTHLTCGSTYSARVVAMGNSCSSAPSPPVVISSVPCQPTNVSVNVQCANGTAVLSWAPQTGVVQYLATALSYTSGPFYCQTNRTTCTLQGLQCNTVYNFTVQTSNGACDSSYSSTVTGGGVPCPPASFRVVPSVLIGQSQLLRAYWSPVNCPDSSYLLDVSGSIQGDSQSLFEITSYWINRTYFETPVPCSSTYSASVRAQNSGGTSTPSTMVTGTSVPCPPLSVTFTGSNFSAVVSWNSSLFATAYHVYQNSSHGWIQLCNTSQLFCSVTNVSSSSIMVTASNSAGEGAGTMDVYVLSARRKRDLSEIEMGEWSSPWPQFTVEATSDTLRLEWARVEGAEFYSLLIQEQSSSSEPITLTVRGEVSVISKLKPATTYCISISARSFYSPGNYSEPQCVQTKALR